MKMRLICLALIGAGMLLCDLGAPLIGHIRDNAGLWRPVHGVAGAFTIGRPIEGTPDTTNRTQVEIEGDEVVVGKNRLRLRLPRLVTAAQPMGESWYALRTSEGPLALRTDEGREALYELPGGYE